ncbi:uncharacterized protein LOC122661771 [Telopea speciosissima]|uniref:uncharacterized protein LOC122661771 n=1 Tax=Telopea speciosissima TaxID=54955 RepID=UPI001CC43FDA|nr:uncharacterized protein LOC122661771 [Telopea speciosissima]
MHSTPSTGGDKDPSGSGSPHCTRTLIHPGKETLLWYDPWLINGPIAQSGLLIADALGRHAFERVEHILLDGQRWVNRTHDPALDDRWEEIQATKIHSRIQEDLVVWAPTSSGKFSLKSAWDVVRGGCERKEWYNLVWFPHSQPRFSFVCWVALWGRLPTRSLLARWGTVIDPTCYLCGNAVETTDHLLFECDFSSAVWREVLSLNGFNRNPLGTWKDVVEWLVSHFNGGSLLGSVRKFSFISSVYRLWQERNARAHLKRPTINCDGSVKGGFGGYGAIGRNYRGEPVFALAGGIQESDVVCMELHAIRSGLQRARVFNLSQVQVRSDSQVAIQMVVGTYKVPCGVLWLVEEICELRDSFRSCTFIHHVREINCCADYLAGYTSVAQIIHFDLHNLPLILSEMIQNDAKGKVYSRM